jgi:hypothetical protein
MSDEIYLKQIARDIFELLKHVREITHYMKEAESEVPEKMRRFIMYMHDMHDVKNLYDEHGITVPPYVLREVERCDDRLRQLLMELHASGGTFDKVRREMTKDTENKWTHSQLLPKQPPLKGT